VSSLVGRTLSHYQIVDEISRGGMGVVYRAIDVRLNREVALKVLPADLVADEDRRSRFVQEAQAASALEHPHIAVIHEIDEADGISLMAMELVRGEKLGDLTARGPIPPGRALELAIQVAEGLARAHDKGIVHRDLKPANVMLTEDGHAKIIDFGLAKLVETLSGDSIGATRLKAETDPGLVLGTVSYMSPEQARGTKVDHRSDIFSFGVLLHEMLTGRPPFRGHTSIDTMHAILHDPVPSLPPFGSGAPAEATHDVQRILDKSLEKDPDQRYQGMRDVVVDLRAARRRLESTGVRPVSVAVAAARVANPTVLAKAQGWLYLGILVLGLVVSGVGSLMKSRDTKPAAASNGKPSVAVLYFENNTGNPQLDWLRSGLTDMLVTDLSQSPDVEVLSTDRLVQILTDMKRQDDRVVSFDTVQELARRAGVKSVILGSYVKAGETIRINLKLQEASTGRIVSSERVEAAGESNLFPTMDDLTRRVKERFAIAGRRDPTAPLLASPGKNEPAVSGVDRDLKEVTTSSIEAYRYYAEGVDMHQRGREQEAVPLLEQAVAIDPGFAMALAKLGIVHGNLVHFALSQEYRQRAFEHVDRLTLRERFYIEGLYYASRDRAKAIEAYRKALELYPDHASARHNLADVYLDLERLQEAIPQLEELRRRGMTFPSTYGNLAQAYAMLGQFEKARGVLDDFIRTNPDSATAYRSLGDVLTAWNKPADAAAAYDRAEALRPGSPFVKEGRWNLLVMADRWTEADAAATQLRQSSDSFAHWVGAQNLAAAALYRGHTTEALKLYEAAAAGEGARRSPLGAGARGAAGTLLADTGHPAEAMTLARRALEENPSGEGRPDGLFLLARAQSDAGQHTEAARTLDELNSLALTLPGNRGKRLALRLTGVLALNAHDTKRAVQELKQAEALLTANAVPGPPSDHVPLWFDLGSAYMASGDMREAGARFQRIADSGVLRTSWPTEFVRSLYFLGQVADRQGEHEKARVFYRRFVDYWGDGDMDRDRVADARKKLAGS
jgi:serine/threonine protein kinase/tetratricopeptide (TPR) repeat protein